MTNRTFATHFYDFSDYIIPGATAPLDLPAFLKKYKLSSTPAAELVATKIVQNKDWSLDLINPVIDSKGIEFNYLVRDPAIASTQINKGCKIKSTRIDFDDTNNVLKVISQDDFMKALNHSLFMTLGTLIDLSNEISGSFWENF